MYTVGAVIMDTVCNFITYSIIIKKSFSFFIEIFYGLNRSLEWVCSTCDAVVKDILVEGLCIWYLVGVLSILS